MQYNDELLLAIEQYLEGKATAAQKQLVDEWYHSFDDGDVAVLSDDMDYEERLEYRLKLRIAKSTETDLVKVPVRKVLPMWGRVAAVAAAVTAITLGVYFFKGESGVLKQVQDDVVVNDIAPGQSGATITLANGQVIQLSGAKKGVVVGSEVLYSDGSVVRYSSGAPASGPASPGQKPTGPVEVRSLSLSDLHGADGRVQMLSASTAKGQTYEFTLPDGTHVWLNADSKLSFPNQFSGRERKILLSGEAYFAVVHNAKQPFLVESTGADGKKQTVEDIGTEFNINAYADDYVMTTTLVEGSASVRAFDALTGRQNAVLTAGQQAIQNARGGMQVLKVDPEQAIAWKKGMFSFKNADLGTVMKQMARWYNVEVAYEGKIPNKVLTGKLYRKDNGSQLLNLLSFYGIQYRVEQKTIIILDWRFRQ